jgi:enoyl-CoA hydratase/3-hydroxyacyl-CoA dehydrogenase
MVFEIFGKRINKIGVVGSGQIGPDIALHFTKSLHTYGVSVVVNDVAQEALDSGQDKLRKKVEKGVGSGAFKPGEAGSMVGNVKFSSDKNDLVGCDLVVEAATERVDIKRSIFRDLERICPEDAILASNSSHLEPDVIFAEAKRPSRCACVHYFFPAERNRMLEVIPGKDTAEDITNFLLKFYEMIGKLPIRVRSRYGYAIDPIFEGLFEAAVLCVEEGIATTKQVDAIACRVLGLGVGPFTAMNLTGGNPITQEGLHLMHEKIMPWFRSPKILDDRIKSGRPWEVPAKGERVEYSETAYRNVSENLMGAYFGLACEILQNDLVDAGDLEMGVEVALVMTPPFRFMNDVGVSRALELVETYAGKQDGFVVAQKLKTQAQSGLPWEIPFVRREDRGDVAVLTIKRPASLNALNQGVISQMRQQLLKIKEDASVRAVVLTGYGSKAFVSGADIGMLAALKSAAEGEELCRYFQEITLLMESLGKPVVCALNGLAFGGGSELSLACTARVAKAGVKALCSQPEPKLGIIPGSGGTQRLPRIIGFENAWRMLRSAGPISSEQASEYGLVDQLVEGDVVDAAVQFARGIANGSITPRPMPKDPVNVPRLPDVDIGSLSKKIDSILQRAILEGAKLPLGEGLALEAKLFGECLNTRDGRIGLDNFLKTALKQPAQFVHE